jgi:hypothetical protein
MIKDGPEKPGWTETKWDTSASTDDVKLLGDNIDTIVKNTELYLMLVRRLV